MGIRLNQNDFKLENLSWKAAALTSEFALILYRRYGVLIDVDSSDAILRVMQNGMRYKDRRLRAIHLHIKTELHMKITNLVVGNDLNSNRS